LLFWFLSLDQGDDIYRKKKRKKKERESERERMKNKRIREIRDFY
jgi:hypothetical protein